MPRLRRRAMGWSAPPPLLAGVEAPRTQSALRIPHVNAAQSTHPLVRERARAAALNDGWVASGVEAWASNAVGAGIVPRSEHPDAVVREALASLWLDWTDEADAENLGDFYAVQAQLVRSLVIDGEAFVRFVYPDDARTVPFRLQQVPAEMVDEALRRDLDNGGRIRSGIEFDASGRRVAYHVRINPPGEPGWDLRTERVPASEMLHVFRPIAPGQVRGVSWLAPILIRAMMLDHHDDAELDRQKTAALFAGFVRRSVDPDPFGADDTDDPREGLLPVKPGMIQYLNDNEEITFPDTPTPVSPEFAKRHLRSIAAGLGLPYHTLTGDLAETNFSSARAALLEFRRRVEAVQHHVLVYQFCRPVWDRWVALAALSGAIADTDPAALRKVSWLPPRWDWVDPQKDAQAEILQIEAGLKSRTQALRERGYDPEQVDADIAADRAREKRLGLSFSATTNEAPPDDQ